MNLWSKLGEKSTPEDVMLEQMHQFYEAYQDGAHVWHEYNDVDLTDYSLMIEDNDGRR